ncbi:MAG: TatD family hydrolase [Gammaproteobacteria bacterium]|nr:MAG: TatD family hydrolase [Gammaproteobacteria bacterium]
MEIIDTHCHLDTADFDADRNDILNHCYSLGIKRIVVPAIEAKTWFKVLELCETEKGLYPALGLHPVFLEQHQTDDINKLEKLLETESPVAIGEIGLDFYVKELDQQQQLHLFEAQLLIAKNSNLPVILHVRKAHDQVLQLLKKYRVNGGFCHAFNGSMQQADKYIELGFKLGFGGTLTYDNSRKIHKLAKELPLEFIVLETDAPDMVVESHRGERNSPEYIVDALAALAKIRNEGIEFIAQQTTRNANEVINFADYDRK